MSLAAAITKNLDEQRAALVAELVNGGAKDYAHYRHLCGQVKALNTSISLVKETGRKYEEDADEQL